MESSPSWEASHSQGDPHSTPNSCCSNHSSASSSASNSTAPSFTTTPPHSSSAAPTTTEPEVLRDQNERNKRAVDEENENGNESERIVKSRQEQVRKIQRNITLTPLEKQKRIHLVMCQSRDVAIEMAAVRARKRPRTRGPGMDLEKDGVGLEERGSGRVKEEEDMEEWWHDKEKRVLGCKHYARKCRILSDCCNQYVGCRLCHDELLQGHHKMDRTKTQKVMCLVCKASDLPIGQNCSNCGVQFSEYYCAKCKFWVGGEKGDQVYHCDGCELCRLGKGLCTHCDRCEVCVPNSVYATHRCREKMVDRHCPICKEYLASSTEHIYQLVNCGHAIHGKCLLEHWRLRYTCPICMKTIADMESVFRQLDCIMERELRGMPQEYQGWKSRIYCQDCYGESKVKYHFAYHRCQHCKSYNTRVNEIEKDGEQVVEPMNANRTCCGATATEAVADSCTIDNVTSAMKQPIAQCDSR